MSFYVHSTHLHRSIQPFTYLPQLWPILLPCLSSQRFLCHIHQLHNRNELDNHFLHNQSFSSAWFHWEILANSSQSIRVASIPTTFLISIFFTVSTVSDVDYWTIAGDWVWIVSYECGNRHFIQFECVSFVPYRFLRVIVTNAGWNSEINCRFSFTNSFFLNIIRYKPILQWFAFKSFKIHYSTIKRLDRMNQTFYQSDWDSIYLFKTSNWTIFNNENNNKSNLIKSSLTQSIHPPF